MESVDTNPHALVNLSIDEIAVLFRDNLDFLAGTLIPDETLYEYPEFYKEVWAYLLSGLFSLPPQSFFRFALGLPRGHIKTTILKLFIVYLIIHDYGFSFFLIVCATEPLAENFLSDVNDIMSSDIITQLYGSWTVSLRRDTRKIKVANFLEREVIIAAIGAQTSLRGLNIGNKRPQFIVCDDVQTKENDDSEVERLKLLQWLVGTLFKSRSKVGKAAVVYLGNMYSNDCILNQFKNNPHWVSLITGAILADGSALWGELNSIETLVEEYNHDNTLGLGSIWFAEVQNDPIGAGGGLLSHGESIPVAADSSIFSLGNYPVRFICIDPAGHKTTSDDNVVGCFCLMEEEQVATFDLYNAKADPETVIKKTIELILKYHIPIVFVESNAYQGTLAFWLEKYLKASNLNNVVIVQPLPSGATSKFQRIKAWVRLLVAKKWHLIGQTIHNKATFQIYSYKTTRTNNVDDIIDANAMALKALNTHRRLIFEAQHNFQKLVDSAPIPRVRANNTILDHLRRQR